MSATSAAPEIIEIAVEHNTPIPMRDGTILRASVFRPTADGRYPVILVRNVYGEALVRGQIPTLTAPLGGMAVVVQDTRGSGNSDGASTPFVDETADGLDTIAWCACQPWSSGAVGMMGVSYLGATQLLAARAAPPALKAIAPGITASEYYEGWTYQGGAFQLGFMLQWALGFAMRNLGRLAAAGQDVGALRSALMRVAAHSDDAVRYLPLRDIPGLAELAPAWLDWLDHPTRDAWWEALSIRNHHGDFRAPALHVGGWSDIFLKGTLENFVGLRAAAATDEARRNQRLIVGPWAHGSTDRAVGQIDFGMFANQLAFQLEAKQLDFLARFLKPHQPEPQGAPVSIFVMGDNVWRDEADWPLTRAQTTRYFLHTGGTLSPAPPPTDAEPSTFTYDPRDPVPTVGGPTLLPGGWVTFNAGPRDQREVEARADVLCFTSAPITSDVEVTGPLSATLHAASSAVDTDWTCKLVDVWPDGRAMSVIDGILRARARNGLEPGKTQLMEPGRVYRFDIDLVATSMVFKAGHRIRVEVSSSNFPRFDRNPNNGRLSADAHESTLVPARQVIFHDAERPSWISLPIVPRGTY
jgi:putative CocE/NonD family hydrolase